MATQPIFERIFAEKWSKLPAVFKRRYANRSHCNDEVVVEGILTITVSFWMKCLAPFLRFCGALVPFAGDNIRVKVCLNSDPKSDAIGFNRTFYYPDKEPYHFRSILKPTKGLKVIEFMRFGLGWRMRYLFEDNKIKLCQDNYIWRCFKLDIPLPFTFILGKGYAEESAVSDTEFTMLFEITHPLFGKVFGYNGQFKLLKSPT